MAETTVLQQTKKWLAENGVHVGAFDGTRTGCVRSQTVILVKNHIIGDIPHDTTNDDLRGTLFDLIHRKCHSRYYII